jgi:hypothetical protein
VCSNGTNRHPDFLTLILPPGFLSPFYPLATHFPKWHQPIPNSFTVVRRTPQVVMWWDIPCWRQVEAWTIAHLKAPVKDGDDEGHYRHCGISGRPFRFLGLVVANQLGSDRPRRNKCLREFTPDEPAVPPGTVYLNPRWRVTIIAFGSHFAAGRAFWLSTSAPKIVLSLPVAGGTRFVFGLQLGFIL